MAKETGCRLETACKCLDLDKPSREEWLKMSDEECLALSSMFGSLSDPVRVRIVEMLGRGPLYVCIIQYLLDDIKYSRLSYHLDILRTEGIVDSNREGNFLRYSLTPWGKALSKKIMGLKRH